MADPTHGAAMITVHMKRRFNSDGVKVYRATIRQDGAVREMIEAVDPRVVRRMLRHCGYLN